ncbi:diguanylate cyclase [Clostridium sp. AM58-1XD]|uniref:diguanylate cyclase domain-containing protein n=1 Tax=Clostridium sp. AM58-1XD TaxID=2292307 RepID=UPI000E4C338C|nr:diguanylate cyclase [Clostridium sp. AM58-1XD]RGY98746.1 diguanylate cyclase [Clostridium sp. AM58-1XD]
MNIQQTDFHTRAREKMKQIWHLYILNINSGQLAAEIAAMPGNLVVIGTGRHEMYENREAFIAGMEADQTEAQEVEFDILDEWYEVQAITADVCCIYGTIWVREKAALGKMVYVEMNSRFTAVCRDTPDGVQICSIHHSIPYVDQSDQEYYPRTLSALAEEAVQKNMVLERRMELDASTELLNRVASERHIGQAMRKESGVFIMLDLDNFKEINDTAGHLQGDHVIQQFAQLLREVFHSRAILGRMGGDEFAVWCPGIAQKEAEDRFCMLVEKCSHVSDELGTPFCCSAGMSYSEPGHESFMSLYQRADQALYQAKFNGKGQAKWDSQSKEAFLRWIPE